MSKRWSVEYLRSLRERHQNLTGSKGTVPAVGDVVVLKTVEKNCEMWPLGIVEELTAGNAKGVIFKTNLRFVLRLEIPNKVGTILITSWVRIINQITFPN